MMHTMNDFERYATTEFEAADDISNPGPRFTLADLAVPEEIVEAMRIQKLVAPQLPMILLPNNFECAHGSLEELIANTRGTLESLSVNYEFVERDCFFKLLIDNETEYCEINLRIFKKNGTSGEFVVELQKMSKESCGFTFNRILYELRNKLEKN